MLTAVGIDSNQIESGINATSQSHYLAFSLHLYDSVTSTNQTLWELLQQGAPSGTVVIATEQTSGRGQWGRQWLSQRGGLYLSAAIAPNLEATNSYQLTLATAWGIAMQLQKCGITVEIKWPNDLVLDKRKLGGILTETKVSKGKITQAVIGVGINWQNPVPETGINLESWQASQHSQPINSLEIIAQKVLLGIESGMECLNRDGVDMLMSEYTKLLINMGDKVLVNNLSGTVVGVTSSGSLHVRTENSELKSVRTREIYLQPGTISLGYRNFSE